ncbi:type IV secretory system conjugative DNA transfer family protein [Spirosoma migulaei]
MLSAKNDELATWRKYAKETGREDSLIVFDSSGQWRFPFLSYEVNREGDGAGNTENLVRLFMMVYEAINRSKGGVGDPYWTSAMNQLLRNAIDLCLIARGTVSVPLLAEIVRSAPQSVEQRDLEDEEGNNQWRNTSLCWKLLSEGHARTLDQWTQYDFDTSASYWLEEFPSISSKTRSGIVSMFTTTADLFLRRPFRMLFSEAPGDEQQIALPELTHHGMIVIMNLPVKEYGDAGRAAQIIYKTLWQQAAERRDVTKNPRPIFLWADECQNFITDYDFQYQATARSSRACTVYLTQNLPNLYAELGNHDRVHALIGNLSTRIWHANSDPETNTNAAETIGRSWHRRSGESQTIGSQTVSLGESKTDSFDYDVPPQIFTRLAKGGPENGHRVFGIIFQNGRTWDGNKNYLLTSFKQQM